MSPGAPALRRAVFFDRDGTLNVDFGFVRDPAAVALVPGAIEGCKLLADAGFALIVASNQSGIARGVLSVAEADAVDAKIRELFAAAGVELGAFYRCPHFVGGAVSEFNVACACRKPKPGMLFAAANEHGIDLKRSWLIGDRARDIAAGIAARCRAVAVEPVPPLLEPEDVSKAAYRARDLVDAARFIISQP